MGINTWKGQIKIVLKDKYIKKIQDNREVFRNRSPTQEMYERIDRVIEEAETPEERVERLKEEAERKMEEAEKWERKAKQKNAKKDLRHKKEDLGKIEEKLQKIKSEGLRTEEEIRQDIIRKRKERGHNVEEPEIKERIEAEVKEKLEKQPDLEDLKNQKKALEKEIKQLEEILSD